MPCRVTPCHGRGSSLVLFVGMFVGTQVCATNNRPVCRPLEKKTEPFVVPGPGTYKTGSKQVPKAQASMSSFVSTADRNMVGEPAVKVYIYCLLEFVCCVISLREAVKVHVISDKSNVTSVC